MGKARAYKIALRSAAPKEAATKAGRQPPAKKAAPPNRVFAGECPRHPAAAAGHKPTDTPVATGKTAGKQCQKVTRKDIAEQKKAPQELTAAQRAATARTVREATKAAQASGEMARKDAQERIQAEKIRALRLTKKEEEQDRPNLDKERRRHARIPRNGDESSDVSSTPSLRAEDEHPPSTSTPGPGDINIVEPGQLAVDGYEPMDS
ncbi:hypothetical protein PI124_g23117 [Phytophthora idaei]|nr:hypothetical protein PI125_g24980 [Phytophthora idaei]KAG3128042.1 hypothetical protein PI126_g21577 [Phytophthora idaei]KAG3231789.1 hypothetical protein PI124_g23117 [Phytophthora idaei]